MNPDLNGLPDGPPFKDRLQLLIGQRSVNAFAKLCGVPESTLRSYLSGRSKPGLEHTQRIADACGVNRYWLVTGMGSPRRDEPGAVDPFSELRVEDQQAGYGQALSRTEMALVENYRRASDDGKRALRVVAESLASGNAAQTFNAPVQNVAGRDVKHISTGDVQQGKGGRIG